MKGGTSVTSNLFRTDRAGEMQFAHGIVDLDVTVLDQEAPDRRQLPGVIGSPAAPVPVGLSCLVAHQQDVGPVDAHQGQHKMAAQQWPKAEFERKVIHPGGLASAHPGGIAEIQALRLHPGLPGEQLHRQVAVNPHFPAGAVGQVATDRAAHLIPVQEVERDNRRDQQRQQCDAAPFEKSTPTEAKVPEIRNARAPRRATSGREGCRGGRSWTRQINHLVGLSLLPTPQAPEEFDRRRFDDGTFGRETDTRPATFPGCNFFLRGC